MHYTITTLHYYPGALELLSVSITALLIRIVTKMTPVHENFIPKISIYKKVMFFTNIFSIENLEPYGIVGLICPAVFAWVF